MLNKNKIKNKEKGFVVLIAIVVSTLLVSIGAFIANVTYKELILSSSTKSTQMAFYATNTAVECALYQDFRIDQFKVNSADVDYPEFILCNDDGDEVNVNKLNFIAGESQSALNEAISIYEGSLAENQLDEKEVRNSGYVRIKVFKESIIVNEGELDEMIIPGAKTTIEVWGHNKKSGLGMVERAMKVEY